MDRIESLVHLAEAVTNGRPEKLSRLLTESAGIVHAFARSRLGDTLAAEEATQDALTRVARAVPTLRDPRAYPAWVKRIVLRCAADVAKRSIAEIQPERTEPEDPADDPLTAAAKAERVRDVRSAVQALPEQLRSSVLLHYAEGLSYREIAALTGRSLSTVARRMEAALGRLRRILKEEP